MSSDYLDMPQLTEKCVEYVVEHIKAILSQKEVIPTYKSHIAKNIARRFADRKMHAGRFIIRFKPLNIIFYSAR